MNRIATVKYSFNPLTNIASLYLLSPALENLYKELDFPNRVYSRSDYDLFQDFTAYLVRGISIDKVHEFERNGMKYRVFTQKCAVPSLLVNEEDRSTINISHIRAVGIGKGFNYQIRPLPTNRIKQIMLAYSEGVIEYYNCLKNHLALQKTWTKNLDNK